MAGYTSRFLFTSISSCVAVLSLIWYSRKRKFLFLQQSIQESENGSTSDAVSVEGEKLPVNGDVPSPMNLKEQQVAGLAQEQTLCPSGKPSTDNMHLKEKSQESEFTNGAVKGETEHVNGSIVKKLCNGSQQHHDGENSTICDTVARTNGVSTNGSAPAKYDNNASFDKPDSTVSIENGGNKDKASKLNGYATAASVSNGISTLRLDEDSAAAVLDMPNGDTIANGKSSILPEQKMTETHRDTSSQTTESIDTLSHTMNTSTDKVLVPEEPNNMPSLVDIATTNGLSCQTDFERKTITPDSGVSAELQECGSPCSSISEPCISLPDDERHIPSPTMCFNDKRKNGTHKKDFNREETAIVNAEEATLVNEGATAATNTVEANCFPHSEKRDGMQYDFEIPQNLCGYLIGKNGRNVRQLSERTNASIMVIHHPVYEHIKVCSVSGTEKDIMEALSLIREKFPLEKHPELTLEQINPSQTECTLPVTMRLPLPAGVSFDAVLSSTVTPGHFFVQQPTHPTFHTLPWMTQCMTSWYSQYETPGLSRVCPNYIVAAPMLNGWYRAQITEVLTETDECIVKFLDFGGFSTIPTAELRQMRMEFTYIPFQAVECYMADITYPEGETDWSSEAKTAFEELAQGPILQGYIIGYEGDIPFVQLYKRQGATSVDINRELVAMGLARWISNEKFVQVPEDNAPSS